MRVLNNPQKRHTIITQPEPRPQPRKELLEANTQFGGLASLPNSFPFPMSLVLGCGFSTRRPKGPVDSSQDCQRCSALTRRTAAPCAKPHNQRARKEPNATRFSEDGLDTSQLLTAHTQSRKRIPLSVGGYRTLRLDLSTKAAVKDADRPLWPTLAGVLNVGWVAIMPRVQCTIPSRLLWRCDWPGNGRLGYRSYATLIGSWAFVIIGHHFLGDAAAR